MIKHFIDTYHIEIYYQHYEKLLQIITNLIRILKDHV